ncbi:hypothetical protein JCM10003_77 [Bacteroides pyogenes JCM 10003]|nr:hypothetical protein JCM10003_77 [Bacteroides pyogenes JCM 10003]
MSNALKNLSSGWFMPHAGLPGSRLKAGYAVSASFTFSNRQVSKSGKNHRTTANFALANVAFLIAANKTKERATRRRKRINWTAFCRIDRITRLGTFA